LLIISQAVAEEKQGSCYVPLLAVEQNAHGAASPRDGLEETQVAQGQLQHLLDLSQLLSATTAFMRSSFWNQPKQMSCYN